MANNNYQAYLEAFNAMGHEFTSYQYKDYLRQNGLKESDLTTYKIKNYLRHRATRISMFTYRKNPAPNVVGGDSHEESGRSLGGASYEEAFEMALELMPDAFTSTQFGAEARGFGVPDAYIYNRGVAEWLTINAIRTGRKRWRKKHKADLFAEEVEQAFVDQAKSTPMPDGITESVNDPSSEKKAIILLKSLGYRIMKPKTEWEDV